MPASWLLIHGRLLLRLEQVWQRLCERVQRCARPDVARLQNRVGAFVTLSELYSCNFGIGVGTAAPIVGIEDV
jgi:hypothetical protein